MTKASRRPIPEDSQAIQAHLSILQSVIQRMSSNSSSAKTWCVTIVSAILVVISDKEKPHLAWILSIPIGLFFVLDVYYLMLEKGFRKSYAHFVDCLHDSSLCVDDLFEVEPRGRNRTHLWAAIRSISVWPFYSLLALMTLAAVLLVVNK